MLGRVDQGILKAFARLSGRDKLPGSARYFYGLTAAYPATPVFAKNSLDFFPIMMYVFNNPLEVELPWA